LAGLDFGSTFGSLLDWALDHLATLPPGSRLAPCRAHVQAQPRAPGADLHQYMIRASSEGVRVDRRALARAAGLAQGSLSAVQVQIRWSARRKSPAAGPCRRPRGDSRQASGAGGYLRGGPGRISPTRTCSWQLSPAPTITLPSGQGRGLVLSQGRQSRRRGCPQDIGHPQGGLALTLGEAGPVGGGLAPEQDGAVPFDVWQIVPSCRLDLLVQLPQPPDCPGLDQRSV